MSVADASRPVSLAADYRVRFDEASPAGLVRGSALLGYVQDVAWRHSEALGFAREWYRERGIAWLVRAVEVEVRDRMVDGATLTVDTRLTGSRRVMMRRRTEIVDDAGSLLAVVTIDWVMTDGRVPVRVPPEFAAAPLDGPGHFDPIRVDLPPTPVSATVAHLAPRLRELDPMGHANNGVYLDWLDETVAAAGAGGEAAIMALPRTYRLEYLRPAGPAMELVSAAWPDASTGCGWAYRLADAVGVDLLRGRLTPA
jgi:acyl-CoA thioesterase FadM